MLKDRNAESIESMLRRDRTKIAIEEKFKSAKKYLSGIRKNGKILFH